MTIVVRTIKLEAGFGSLENLSSTCVPLTPEVAISTTKLYSHKYSTPGRRDRKFLVLVCIK